MITLLEGKCTECPLTTLSGWGSVALWGGKL